MFDWQAELAPPAIPAATVMSGSPTLTQNVYVAAIAPPA